MRPHFCAIISLLLFGSLFSHAARLDGRLQQILRDPRETSRHLQVLLVFRDEPFLARESLLNRQGVQWALVRNAESRQAAVMRILQASSRAESRIHYRRFWLGNTVAVSGPVHLIRKLVLSEDVESAALMGKVELIRSFLHREDPPKAGAFTWSLEKMRIPEVRRNFPGLDGRGVRVGILDTGIDGDHQDLHGKVLAFADFSEKENRPYDDHGHGTHVAGSIAGGNRSGAWIGVAPKAGLVVGKIFDEWGSADQVHMLEGMQWVADPDGDPATNDAPHVVSNSWGSDIPGGDPADHALCRAVDHWVKLSILPVFAAGNHGPRAPSVSVPAACPAALAVGATDESDVIAKFSSRGPVVWSTGSLLKPEISAPGVKVLSAGINGRYVTMSGTSMASPHVAGVAALLYQLSPQARPEEIARKLMRGSIDLGATGADPVYGSGRLDAVKTIEAALRFR